MNSNFNQPDEYRVLDIAEIDVVSGGRCESSESWMIDVPGGTLVVGYKMCGGVAMPFASYNQK
jgi:hypothetical protein